MAIKVKLRQKAISGNRQSLYLDFYPAITNPETGLPTRREFLGLYISNKPSNPLDKQHNKEVLQVAEQIRQKKEIALNKPEIYSGYELEQLKIKERGELSFIDYFSELADKRKKSNHDNWLAALRYLKSFAKNDIKFSDLNVRLLNEFKEYLLTTQSNKSNKVSLSQNSALSYFNKVKATLKQAYKEGYLQSDLNAQVDGIKEAETHRNFLTKEELNTLKKTECQNPMLKNAAIFSALTGLRFSDIQKLLWGEIEFIKDEGYFLHYKQQKTKNVERLPISEQAYELLGEKGNAKDNVFEGLKYSAYSNKHLAKWIGLAGITKDITFHCFRHTYATLQLSAGTDLYTVSKMLGHRDLKTTQLYAKIIDQTKRTAANKIQLDF
jgi:integrase